MEKRSKQRSEILELLKNSYDHPTAEEIYTILKKNNSTASVGTVYRNLNSLLEKGIIIKIPIKNGPDRFDYMKIDHNHAVCNVCGKVFDFEYNINLKRIREYLNINNEFLVSEQPNIIIHGICKECKIAKK